MVIIKKYMFTHMYVGVHYIHNVKHTIISITKYVIKND